MKMIKNWLKSNIQKIKKWLKDLLKNKDVIYAAICLLVLLAVLLTRKLWGETLTNYVDLEMFTSVVAAFFLTTLATAVAKWFTALFEDSTKLTGDFDALVKMYQFNTDMLPYRNSPLANYKLGRKKTACKGILSDTLGDTYQIPVGDVIQLHGREVKIHDAPQKRYALPEFSREHYTELLAAHGASNTFNQLNLRVDRIREQDGAVCIDFSRTTYFDSLVTNRAIDYKISGVSVRDLYCCGPLLPPLDQSMLSNHMGFNGMVETSDHKFVFIKRHNHVSVGKNTMQCSVAASLKASRALDEKGRISKEKISSAIIREIVDELNLNACCENIEERNRIFEGFSFDKNVLYFYRDLTEGGKPQLMFYGKLNMTSAELKKIYTQGTSPLHRLVTKNRLYCAMDGYKMLLVDRADMEKIYLTPDSMVIHGRRYPAMPSAVGTVVMLMKAKDMGLLDGSVQECFTVSKKGNNQSNEDAFFVSSRFIAVVDGVTPKTAAPANAKVSAGCFASQIVCDCLKRHILPADPQQLLTTLNNQLKEAIKESPFKEQKEPPAASIILYDKMSGCVIRYGDCQMLLNGNLYQRGKKSDDLCAHKRADILQACLQNGQSVTELLKCDPGRASIVSDILNSFLENANKETENGFPVLGLGKVVPNFVEVWQIPAGTEVILASDGYPLLKSTLAESERELSRIIETDPLLIGEYKATKGVTAGNASYDDRTYIRFTA